MPFPTASVPFDQDPNNPKTQLSPPVEPQKPVSHLPILCLDFDGVCHMYTSGWINAWTILDPPVYGLFPFLEEAMKSFRVCIFSSRSAFLQGREAMQDWFAQHAMNYYRDYATGYDIAKKMIDALEYPVTKPSATVTLDDRGLTFTGKWPSIDELKRFKPWNDHLKRRSNTEKAQNPAPNITSE